MLGIPTRLAQRNHSVRPKSTKDIYKDNGFGDVDVELISVQKADIKDLVDFEEDVKSLRAGGWVGETRDPTHSRSPVNVLHRAET